MSRHLQIGDYYGAVQGRGGCDGVTLTELSHSRPRKLPRHSHEACFLTLVLKGDYREQFLRARPPVEYQPFSVGFHPPGLAHQDEIGNAGASLFMVELSSEFLRKHSDLLPAAEPSPQVFGSKMTSLATRLYAAFKRESATPLEAESLTLEMLAVAADTRAVRESGEPPWLRRAWELLHARYAEPLTVTEVAREVGVHPVHLSRVFRARYRQTLGDALQQLRIQAAARALACSHPSSAGVDSEWGTQTLAEVALASGFFDQAHFCRVFKQHTGVTPGALRSFLAA